mmetsp:Transcript_10304/g.23198  ORF Transcript_10304/g.23198 Transcript_10304/m.23198 type:complete len:318 (-) Transcript_10304:43-996(-)
MNSIPYQNIHCLSRTPMRAVIAFTFFLVTTHSFHIQREVGRLDHEAKGPPEMFVAIFSYPAHNMTRQVVRDAWLVPSSVVTKFIICDDNPSNGTLLAENTAYKDILWVRCEEGYSEGRLTRKLVAAMTTYLENYNTPFFYKVDDDSLPNFDMILHNIHGQGDYVYAGLMYHGPNFNGTTGPLRNASSRWYEPWDTWPDMWYPVAASGGAGYILSRSLVSQFITVDPQTTEKYMLWNEDKAVGVWVDRACKNGVNVSYVNITGCDGYHLCDDSLRSEPISNYLSLCVKQNLSPQEVKCLVQPSNAEKPTDYCLCHDSV